MFFECEIDSNFENDEEFVRQVKDELFTANVYPYTPTGDGVTRQKVTATLVLGETEGFGEYTGTVTIKVKPEILVDNSNNKSSELTYTSGVVDFIKNVGDKIITTHISDYDFVNERHWIPGEGDIDWLELYNALKEVNYKGVWLYETGLRPPKSIIRRDLTYKDLYENANQIFNNINPTPIGKRIENLGFWV